MLLSEYVGHRFGQWTVVETARPIISGRTRNALRCVCDCGRERFVLPGALRLGQSTRCRVCCNQAQAAKKSRLTHGQTETRLYNIWCLMLRRCGSPTCQDYHRYGGRGITVCAEWRSFQSFADWANASGYTETLTIDRRDNNGNYEPSNCRWITRIAQNRNRRDNRRYQFQGRMLMVSEIAEITGQPLTMLRQRIQTYNWPVDRAVTQPARRTWKTESRAST